MTLERIEELIPEFLRVHGVHFEDGSVISTAYAEDRILFFIATDGNFYGKGAVAFPCTKFSEWMNDQA